MTSRKVEYGIVMLLSAYVIVYVHRIVTGVMKPELEELANSFGWDDIMFTSAVASAYFYAYAAMQLPGGVLADALGIKRYASLSLSVLAFGTLLMTVGNPYSVIAGRALIGGGAAAIFISVQRYIGVNLGKGAGGRVTGLALSAGNIGALLATTPSRIVIDSVGVPGFLLVLFATSVILALGTHATITDVGLRRVSIKDALKEVLSQLRVTASSIHSWSLALALASTYATVVAFQSYWGPDYFAQVFEAGATEVSVYLMILALSFALFTVVVGWVSDKVLGRRKPILILNSALHALSWGTLLIIASIGPINNAFLPYALSAFVGFSAAFHIVIPPMAREAYPPEYSGTTFAFVNMAGFIGIAIYQSLNVIISDVATALEIFLALSLISLLASLMTRETL